jgi:predicted TIM-barrel fold metal-dependent hydrolase
LIEIKVRQLGELGLSAEVLEGIYSENAKKVLNLTV